MLKAYKGFLIGLFSLVACDTTTPQPAVTSVSINTNPGSVSVGATLGLSAEVIVQNGASKVISWTSSNPSIASVNINSGLVKGEAPGTATITATSVFDSSKSSSVSIAVTGNTNITAVTISPRSATLPVNSTQLFSATVSGSGSFSQAVTWNSSDVAIAEISTGGLVTAKAAGSATITATSVGDPSKKDSVSITVIPAAPLSFSPYQNLLAEINKPIAPQTATVSGGKAPYTFAALTTLPAGLSLNPDSGAISGTPTLATPTTSYSIQVADSLGKTATATIVITVFVPTPTLTYTVFRGLTAGRAITASNYTLTTTGLSGAITFSLNSGTLPPGIALGSSDGSLSGTPTTAGTYNAVIRATDAGNKTADGNLSLVVNPVLSFSTGYPAQIATVKVTFTGSEPVVVGGTAPLIFSASNLPPGLGIRSSDGVINGIPTAPSSSNHTVTVTDANGATATTPVSITVNAGITLSYTLKRPLTEGIAINSDNYSRTISGGAPPYTYSAVSSSLPAGITLNTSTGEFDGLTTETGAFPILVSVTDNFGATGSGTFNLVVNEPVQVQTDYTDPPNELTVGRAFTSSTPQLVGGTSPISYSASGLPSGLSINASTGVISGTPTANKANSDYTVVVKDANGDTEDLTINLEVVAAPDFSYQSPETFTASSLGPDEVISEPDINGGAGVLTYSRTSVSGPDFDLNLSFDPATGAVKNRSSGTPAVGTYVMDIKVTDVNGATDTFRLTIILTPD